VAGSGIRIQRGKKISRERNPSTAVATLAVLNHAGVCMFGRWKYDKIAVLTDCPSATGAYQGQTPAKWMVPVCSSPPFAAE
jgi:hypothetical protein